MRDQATLATQNNIEWCDGVCRAHGIPGEVSADFWIQRRQGPPYYSNLITRSRSGGALQRAAIEGLTKNLPEGFSIKDSFAALDLSAQKFRKLFEAEWVWLADSFEKPTASGWTRIDSPADLKRWERAWAAAGSPTSTRVFLPSLLQDARIAFFGFLRDGEFLAGCIANRSSGDVVGFSNFFAPEGEGGFLAEAVAQVAGFAPGCPVVGYEREDNLAAMQGMGFRSVGKLTVWIWP